MPPGDDTYVYVGSGVLVWRFVLYLTLAHIRSDALPL